LALSSAISETGRYIAFTSKDSNLIDGTTINGNGAAQLYLRDTQADTTTLLSQNASGQLANASIDIVDGVSSDGRFILFGTTATNIGPTDNNTGYENFYLLDRSTGTFTLVNQDANGNQMTNEPLGQAAMSCDGSLIVFSEQQNGQYNVYLRDQRDGNSVTDLTGNDGGNKPTISCNGDYVGFVSTAAMDPSEPEAGSYNHAYVYDRISASYHLIDQSTSGTPGNTDVGTPYANDCNGTGLSAPCVLIGDNGIATFSSKANNLVSGAPSGQNVYVRNITTGETDLVTPSADGTSGSYTPIGMSSDGSAIVYNSNVDDLVSGSSDTNNAIDAFLYQTGY
jgi:Tol biopolymer transport system component